MKIKKLSFILACSLFFCTYIGISNHYNAVKSEDKVIYAIFKNLFTEPIEIMYFLTDDMKLYKMTSSNENKIAFIMWELKRDFKRDGYEISDIIVIIHNHRKQAYFSKSDIIVYGLFKGEGFEGKFYLYVYRNKTIYELAERLR